MSADKLLDCKEAMNCIIKSLILCVVAEYLISAVPFIIVTVFAIQLYYLRTSRQLRLLDIEGKAPLFTHLLETISGVVTIRAFGWETNIKERAYHLLKDSQKPFYMLYCIQQRLTLVLDLVIGAVAVIVIATTTSMKTSFTAGSMGVALNVILTFTSPLPLSSSSGHC